MAANNGHRNYENRDRSNQGEENTDEDENFLPTAPPVDDLDLPPGYEAATYSNDAAVLPPPYESLYPVGPTNRHIHTELSGMTEDDAKEIFLDFVKSKCCYGTKTARELVITCVQNSSAYHYTLKSHSEGRKTAWKFEHYKGEPIPAYPRIPGPWEVLVSVPEPFTKGSTKVMIPETRTVKACHKCCGSGQHRCHKCNGRGQSNCTWCHGSGKQGTSMLSDRCTSCSGSGRQRCAQCHGAGKVNCSFCLGYRLLVHFIQLTVEWKSYEDHHIVERTDLPDKLIKKVSGDTVFQEENVVVQPLTEFWDSEVNSGSRLLVNKHMTEITRDQRVLLQKHTVRVVPVTEVNYEWNQKLGKFFIYGFEKKIYVDKYPQRCCCCCSIL